MIIEKSTFIAGEYVGSGGGASSGELTEKDLFFPFFAYVASEKTYGENQQQIAIMRDITSNKRDAVQNTAANQPSYIPADVPYFLFNNKQVKMPLPLAPADMNSREWSVYFRIAPVSVSGMNPIMSGGSNAANQTFLILFSGANPSISQHSQDPAYLTSSYKAQVDEVVDVLIVHTVDGTRGVNDLYVNDKKNSITWNVNLSVGNANPIVLGNYYAYDYTSKFKLNRIAFWRDKAVTPAEFQVLREQG